MNRSTFLRASMAGILAAPSGAAKESGTTFVIWWFIFATQYDDGSTAYELRGPFGDHATALMYYSEFVQYLAPNQSGTIIEEEIQPWNQ